MRALNKINENESYLKYKSLGKLKDVKIKVYCDGSDGKMDGYHSAIGRALFLVWNKTSAALVDWSSKKFNVPVKSALAAEGEAASETYGKGKFLKSLYEAMTVETISHRFKKS